MKLSVPLARVFGIPIRANVSWFLTFGFYLLLAVDVYPEWLPDVSTQITGSCGGERSSSSIVVRELAHSSAAYGIPVKEITLFFLGGVAHLAREATRPFADFAMAAAGPAASLALAGLLLLVWWAAGFSDDGPLPVMFQFLLFMNLSVGVFNMAPGFPMMRAHPLHPLGRRRLRRATFSRPGADGSWPTG
jgi:Zn-dependent protease